MKRLLLGFLVLLGILIVADRSIQNRRKALRVRASALRNLTPSRHIPAEQVRQIQITLAGPGKTWTYRFYDGAWRYPDDFDAYAQGDRLDRLLTGLLQGLGTVVSTHLRSDAHYGLASHQAMVVHLADTLGASLQGIWVGRSVPGKHNEETYARIAGSDTTLHLHANPRLALDWTPASDRPPMIDPYILPRALSRKSIVNITYRTATPYPVQGLRRVETQPAQPALPGRLPQGPTFEWHARFRNGEKICNTAAAFAYISFLSRLRYENLHDPEAASACGFDDTGLVLEDEDGVVDTLDVGIKNAEGNIYLRHRSAGLIFALAPGKADLLIPTASALLDSLKGDSPYTRAEPTAPFSF